MNNETYISLAKELRHIAVAEAKRYLQDAEDVEDVAQEVMLRIWERREGVIPEKKMMYSYLYIRQRLRNATEKTNFLSLSPKNIMTTT